ncbi:hypothetical protein PMIN01_03917 [Paraphaeosphaeria minitans]|uniref:Uncharacterized protein n=1 Tax=Paraphaeosphaeria minitans TaxID=565426 RepID=A0A9P6GQZ3_9PLEO|nr:hypothetical protein PMIN01_03917 [Paraphaeosphaeria minitans]
MSNSDAAVVPSRRIVSEGALDHLAPHEEGSGLNTEEALHSEEQRRAPKSTGEHARQYEALACTLGVADLASRAPQRNATLLDVGGCCWNPRWLACNKRRQRHVMVARPSPLTTL